MRCANGGARSSSARMAAEVEWRARNCSTSPSNTSVMMAAAASKYTGKLPSAIRNVAGNSVGNSIAIRL